VQGVDILSGIPADDPGRTERVHHRMAKRTSSARLTDQARRVSETLSRRFSELANSDGLPNSVAAEQASETFLALDAVLALLIAERDRLNRAIDALQGPVKRRGRPPKNPLTMNGTPTPAPAKRRRGGMSAAAKKAASARMKAYWAKQRKEAKR